ncbi:MAG: DNA-directed RNA polymerase subunit alpha [Phycisphaerales bacterium]|nr:DNA-directed RNA polymerase subunit alpha [Phycisphaerales bacterium]
MHVRWRGLELPAEIKSDPKSHTETFARFMVEPLERGFGTTVGNSLRRILLSSIEGAAITSVKIGGVDHEFSTIQGVKEDVTDILLNLRGLVISVDSDEDREWSMTLRAKGPGDVTAELIEADPAICVHNPDHVIATLTDEVNLDIEIIVDRGRGYTPASERHQRGAEDQIVGEIPVDSVYSPVLRVRYRVEDTRVGQKTNYDRLVLDIWTDGTQSPEMVLVEAAKILRKHLNAFVQMPESGESRVSEEAAAVAAVDESLARKLDMSVNELDLTVRASNCLETAAVATVSELVCKTEQDLLSVRSFGKTSLREVKKKLEDMGLSLGMQLPDGYAPAPV